MLKVLTLHLELTEPVHTVVHDEFVVGIYDALIDIVILVLFLKFVQRVLNVHEPVLDRHE